MSINWGPWADGGMAADPDREASLRAKGARPLPPDAAINLMLDALADQRDAQPVVFDADWAAMRRGMGANPPAMLDSVLPIDQSGDGAGSAADHQLRRSLIDAPSEERRQRLVELVQSSLARVMSIEPAELAPAKPLAEFGIDSLMSLELKNGLEQRLDVTLPMARLLEGPSIESLAGDLSSLLAGEDPAGEPAASASAFTKLRAGEGPPLVTLPTLGGDALCYRELAGALTGPGAVYALRPRGLDGAEAAPHGHGRACRGLRRGDLRAGAERSVPVGGMVDRRRRLGGRRCRAVGAGRARGRAGRADRHANARCLLPGRTRRPTGAA